MKRILTIAIALAVVLPAVMVGADYNGYENDTKTVLMEWVEDALDSGSVTFDSQAHKQDFLDLIDALYSARDNENWLACVALANLLEAASNNIVAEGYRVTVASLSQVTGEAYSQPDVMIMSDETEDDIKDNLIEPLGAPIIRIITHIGEDSKKNCIDYRDVDGNPHHMGECDKIIEIVIPA